MKKEQRENIVQKNKLSRERIKDSFKDSFKDIAKEGKKYLPYVALGIGALVIGVDMALANAKFDVNAGVAAATTPVIDGLKAHWGKGVLLSGAGAALFGEGDPRQRAIRAGIGCGAAGGVMLGLIGLLG